MKLAEALQERADTNIRLNELRSRMIRASLVQEGEKPAEDPTELMDEFDRCVFRLEELINRINLTNSVTKVEGKTLTEYISKRDCLRDKLSTYRNVLSEAGSNTRRATRNEIKILSTIDIPALQKKIDELSRELRLTDNLIQETNWTTELL